MSWWGDKSDAATVVEPPVDHLQVAHAQMIAAKADLDLLDREMLAFKTRYRVRTDRFSRLLAIESPTLTGRAKIEGEWRTLLARRDVVMTRWHAALHEWSTLKTNRAQL